MLRHPNTDGGVTFKGPCESRPHDQIGLSLAFGRISPRAAAHDPDVAALNGTPTPVRDFEAAIEFTYQVPITESWFVQPDVQYIVHPGGNVANQPDPSGHLAIRKRNRTRRAHDAELLGRNAQQAPLPSH
jgi:porin